MTVDGFQVRFSIASIDESQLSSINLMNYKVEGDEVTRVQPVAVNPVNFVDEWIRKTWRDAQGWSSPGNLAKLHDEHTKLHTQASGSGDFVEYRSCTTPTTTEVRFTANDGDGPGHYFLVKRTLDGFNMLTVTDHPTASCKGPNKLTTLHDR